MAKYLAAYFGGGVGSLTLANWLWYPAPDLHGVQLGLLMGGIFLAGSVVAIGAILAINTGSVT